jgi:uncharacterized protein
MEGLTIRKYQVIGGNDFNCSQCGVCCTLYALVDVHVTDIFRISEHLGMTPTEFFDKHCKIIKNDEDTWTFCMDIKGGCKFQKDKRCSIYEVRPDFCAFYPNSHTSFNLSQVQRSEMTANPGCAVHRLKDDLIFVPDIERMVDSRILYMIKEAYVATHDGFNEADARTLHLKGLAQINNGRMREIVHLQVLNEINKHVCIDGATKEPILSRDEIKTIYKSLRR